MIRLLIILYLFIGALDTLYAQKVIVIDSSFVTDDLNNSWQVFEENIPIKKYKDLEKINSWKNVENFPITFPPKIKSVWLKATLHNSTNATIPIRIFTKGIDSINVFWNTDANVVKSYVSGKNIPLSKRYISSQFLVVPIQLQANSYTKVVIRLYNQSYQLSLPYLHIATPKSTSQFVKAGELGYSIYFGGLSLMILFSIILFIFFREKLYLFYLCCLIGSLIMAAVYNDFFYLLFDKIPEFIKNKNIFAVLTTLLNILYLLFAEQYLKVDTQKKSLIIKLSRVSMIVLLMLLIGLILGGKELFEYRAFFYPLFGVNVTIMYYHLLRSIQKKYSPSWYFLVASTPVVFVSVLEVTSDFNGVPVQTMHDFYYTGTFIEMFFLTIGIVFRFSMERANFQKLQEELFVTEIKTQNRERERISKDLHDNIGASIVGVQLRLGQFAEKYFKKDVPPPDFQKTLLELEQTYKDVRGLSHDLLPQVLTDLGLVEQIKERYGHITKPIFKFSLPAEALELESFVELTLYEIINEAVQNIIKHAKATEVGIELNQEGRTLKLRIEDNGIGFDQNQIKSDGIGLKNIKFRAENQLNANLTIESSPGNGTIILVKIQFKNIP